jgi:hypothetical protein
MIAHDVFKSSFWGGKWTTWCGITVSGKGESAHFFDTACPACKSAKADARKAKRKAKVNR